MQRNALRAGSKSNAMRCELAANPTQCAAGWQQIQPNALRADGKQRRTSQMRGVRRRQSERIWQHSARLGRRKEAAMYGAALGFAPLFPTICGKLIRQHRNQHKLCAVGQKPTGGRGDAVAKFFDIVNLFAANDPFGCALQGGRRICKICGLRKTAPGKRGAPSFMQSA